MDDAVVFIAVLMMVGLVAWPSVAAVAQQRRVEPAGRS
jgi:hypothetical protein